MCYGACILEEHNVTAGGCTGSQDIAIVTLVWTFSWWCCPSNTLLLPWFVLPYLVPLLAQARDSCTCLLPEGAIFTFRFVFFLWATQWTATGMSGRAGAPAQPPAPTVPNSGRGSAMGPPTGEPNAKDTGWRPGTASYANAQVSGQWLFLSFLGHPSLQSQVGFYKSPPSFPWGRVA